MKLEFEVDPVQARAGIGACVIIETCELGSRATWCSIEEAIVRSANNYVHKELQGIGTWDPPYRHHLEDRFCPLVRYS